nr:MAG TPA: hypothetical protein [Caudoviricetes sp.]
MFRRMLLRFSHLIFNSFFCIFASINSRESYWIIIPCKKF